MPASFLGFDHVDTRVRSVKAVESFYDQLMPKLGLECKRYCQVDTAGEWHDSSVDQPYNTVEYYEDVAAGSISRFIGFVEDKNMRPTFTRIAFRVSAPLDIPRWSAFLAEIGAMNIEPTTSDDYPAVFFEDPAGTKLEICARKPKTAEKQ
jgi:catechol 2,3-dioxygenase-like lactoylglutathione lyase family enzyme